MSGGSREEVAAAKTSHPSRSGTAHCERRRDRRSDERSEVLRIDHKQAPQETEIDIQVTRQLIIKECFAKHKWQVKTTACITQEQSLTNASGLKPFPRSDARQNTVPELHRAQLNRNEDDISIICEPEGRDQDTRITQAPQCVAEGCGMA